MRVPDRRAVLAGLALAGAGPGLARRLAPAGLEVNAGPIHWPGPDGRTLHGAMAIPAKARGRQPAVLVLSRAPDFAGDAMRAVAQAGFIACAPGAAMFAAPTARDDLLATLGWLGTNRYASGRVGLIGFDAAAVLVTPLAAAAGDRLAAAVIVSPPGRPPAAQPSVHAALLRLGPDLTADSEQAITTAAEPERWRSDWATAMAFLREHLT